MSKLLRRSLILFGRSNIIRNYRQNAFGKYLLFTNTVSSGIPMFFGDLIQQEIEYQNKKLAKRYDYKRLGRMLLFGLAVGPVHHYIYINLNKYLPGRSMANIAKKILTDQLLIGPLCILLFFSGLGVLEGKSLDSINSEIKSKFLVVYKMDWVIWPPTQFINFYFVPVKYQIMYINLVTVLYDVFLSYVKHRDQDIDKIEEKYNE